MTPVVDMGMSFDGHCCVCREMIHPTDAIWTQATAADGVKHTVAHARCTPEGRAILAEQEAAA